MKKYLALLFLLTVLLLRVEASGRPLAVIELASHPGGTYMMTMKASVNGKQGLFMFDTGGGISYIDPAFAHSIGCEPWGQITGFMLTGQRLDMPRCDGLKFDVAGRNLVSSETGTWLAEHFTETLADMKGLLDELFVAGINRWRHESAWPCPSEQTPEDRH